LLSGIPGFEWQTFCKLVIFLGRRDVYGFLFSVRHAFMTVHLAIRVLFCSYSVNLCALEGNASRTEKRNP
jgi:hypothetical protein